MRTQRLGQSGISASVVGLGAWAIGGWMWGGQSERESINTIRAALDAGITLVDTAPIYGLGVSESVLGKAIRDRRDRVVLATKCGMIAGGGKGEFKMRADALGMNPNGLVEVRVYQGPESIREEVELSLARLQTDYIDLYQTHWQDATTPIEETMSALMDLKQEGKIRAIGVSNATTEQMDAYRQLGPLDADQEKYNMLARGLEASKLPYCKENGIAVLAYSPIAMGLLTGKMGPDYEFDAGDIRNTIDLFSVENRKRVQEMLRQIQPSADGHNITLGQLAIAWTLHQPGMTHALCGARHVKQAQENAAAGDVELSEDELNRIEGALQAYAGAVV